MNPVLSALSEVLLRDLTKLEEEVKAYHDEANLWKVEGAISNSGGNLCLHLCGNLRHFVGKVMGGIPYQRDRDFEFAARNIPRVELLEQIEATKSSVKESLARLDPALLDKPYPIEVFGKPMTALYFLVHLAGHLNYHLGQINYHRRLLE